MGGGALVTRVLSEPTAVADRRGIGASAGWLASCSLDLSALATSKAWSRVNAAREIVAAGVSGEW